jgi:FkbM family methyltransferase
VGFDQTEGNWGLSRVTLTNISANSFEVESSRLDDVADAFGLNAVDFVKMDIEGSEDFALEGCSMV